MKIQRLFLVLLLALALVGCGSDPAPEEDLFEKHINEITAAKSRYAVAKSEAPVLNTHDWDNIFGGPDGTALKYDRYGEVDELVFVTPKDSFFTLQRQIRKKTRQGAETIYYKVTTPLYGGDENLWIDGRFLDLRDVRPEFPAPETSVAKTIVQLRSYEGAPYTWHGSSPDGVPELLDYYPPTEDLSLRSRNDWMLKGFDSLGMLFRASGGETPLTLKEISRFGEPVYLDLEAELLKSDESEEAEEEEDTTEETESDDSSPASYTAEDKVNLLMSKLRPLDIIISGERVWVVLDEEQIIEARYRSKFDGEVLISALYDTLAGLLQKATFVKDPFVELEDENASKFAIRRYINKSRLLIEESLSDDKEDNEADEPPATES